jgi:zinc protease
MKFLLLSFLLLINQTTSSLAGERAEFEEDFALPIVYLNLVAPGGSIQDPSDKAGLAYVASHMLTRGTQKRSKLEFFDAINSLGGSLEVDLRNEGLVIRGAVLSENIDAFLELVTEALTAPRFSKDELEKLKREAVSEILEQKGNDTALAQYNFYRFFYGSHPYGNPAKGTQKGVNKIALNDVDAYYKTNFGCNALTVFGSGAVKKENIETWVSALSQKLCDIHPKSAPKIALPEQTVPSGRRALIVDKPKATQAQVLMGNKGMRPELDGFYAVMLANHSYGGPSFQARLMQEIRVKRGWTYGAYNTFKFGRQDRHFATYFAPKNADTPPAIELSLKMLDEFVSKGITQEEFNFARDSLMNNAPFNFDTSKKRLENATAEYLMNFPKGYFHDLADNIAKVDFEDIAPALKKVFKPENITLTVVGDAKALRGPITKIPGFSKVQVKSYLED